MFKNQTKVHNQDYITSITMNKVKNKSIQCVTGHSEKNWNHEYFHEGKNIKYSIYQHIRLVI